jgi:polyisoprenoid-binding protein YceI
MFSYVVFSAFFACTPDPAKDKAVAAVSDPTPAPAAAAAPTPPVPTAPGLPIDVSTSSIKVVGAKVSKSHDIQFADFSGSYQLEGENVAGIAVTVRTTSLSTDSEKLASHLRSADFLNSDVIAEASFVGTFTPGGVEGKGTHTGKGKLNLHGIEKEITFPATLQVTPTDVQGQAEFAINRQDFQITYPGKPDDLIADSVLFNLSLNAKR